MGHMSGLRRADGGDEAIEEGEGGGFIVLSVLRVDRNDGILGRSSKDEWNI